MPRPLIVMCTLLALLIPLSLVLALTGQPALAFFVSNAGTVLILLGMIAWIVLIDSRKRWPRTSAWERLARLLTFQR